MANKEQLLFLDGKGFVPYPDETEKDFLDRGTILLLKDSESSFLNTLKNEIVRQYSNLEEGRFSLSESKEQLQRQFQQGITIFNQKASADFSWVPIIHFQDIQDGALAFLATLSMNHPYRKAPFFGINSAVIDNDFVGSGVHECFHAIRMSFDNSLPSDKNSAKEIFSHYGSMIYFSETSSKQSPPLIRHLSTLKTLAVLKCYRLYWEDDLHLLTMDQFNSLVKILSCYFGSMNFYVLARLSYDEMVTNFLTKKVLFKSPPKYLREMAKTSLRHKIICLRLGP